jgi:hypothetical protein
VYGTLRALAAEYPSLASVATLGCAASEAGAGGDASLPILALELRGSSARDYSKPIAELVGAMHGDEQIGAELALDLASKILAAGAGGTILASMDLTVVPVSNPWGYENDSRYNRDTVDLNRNFDWAWTYGDADTCKGSSAMSELESKAIAADAKAKLYDLAITMHSGAFCISLPWDYIATSSTEYDYSDAQYLNLYSPAQALFDEQGAAYASLVGTVQGPGSFSSTQGGDWYIVCGSYADWLYGTLGCPGYTVELAPYYNWDSQPASLGAEVLAAHEKAMLGLLASARLGARGRVTRSLAAVSLALVKAAPSPAGKSVNPPPEPYTACAYSNQDGYYYIPLPEGSWSLTASSGGVESAAAAATVLADGPSAPVGISIGP